VSWQAWRMKHALIQSRWGRLSLLVIMFVGDTERGTKVKENAMTPERRLHHMS